MKTLRAGVGMSQEDDLDRALQEAGSRSLAQLGLDQADWVLIFASPQYFHARTYRILYDVTGAQSTVGCSARGLVTSRGELEDEPAVAILSVHSPDIEIKPFYENNLQRRNLSAGRRLAEFKQGFSHPDLLCCVFPDAFSFRAPLFFKGIRETIGHQPVLGGAASCASGEKRTYQLVDEEYGYNALCGFLMGGDFQYQYGVTQSVHPIGSSFLITECDSNQILSLDGRPALEVLARTVRDYAEDMGRKSFTSLYVTLSTNPEREFIDRGEYVVREVGDVDRDKGSVLVQEQVREGQRLSFALPTSVGAREDVEEMLVDLSEDAPDKKPAFGLYLNCCARGTSLYGESDVDLGQIRDQLGDFPLIGFQTFFEIAPQQERNYEHRYSGVLLLVYPPS